jgi:hypothetical protein
MRLPRTPQALVGHRRHPVRDSDSGDLPAALHGPKLRKGLIRVLLFAAVVVALIVALPGLGSIRGRLADGDPAWIGLAASFRFSSALAYVFLFRAIFTSDLVRPDKLADGELRQGENAAGR